MIPPFRLGQDLPWASRGGGTASITCGQAKGRQPLPLADEAVPVSRLVPRGRDCLGWARPPLSCVRRRHAEDCCELSLLRMLLLSGQ